MFNASKTDAIDWETKLDFKGFIINEVNTSWNIFHFFDEQSGLSSEIFLEFLHITEGNAM